LLSDIYCGLIYFSENWDLSNLLTTRPAIYCKELGFVKFIDNSSSYLLHAGKLYDCCNFIGCWEMETDYFLLLCEETTTVS
jgi:hypothetical protein